MYEHKLSNVLQYLRRYYQFVPYIVNRVKLSTCSIKYVLSDRAIVGSVRTS